MAPVNIIGGEDAQEASSSATWSRRDGEVGISVIEGPIDAINTAYAGFKNNPATDTVSVRRANGRGTIELTIAESTQTAALNDIWELLGREIVKDIRTHQDYNQTADQSAIAAARVAVEQGRGADFTPAAGAATDYLALRLRGTSQYVRSQPILRRSVRTSDRGILDVAWDGVDRAWQLNGESGSPNPPADLVGDINQMPEGSASAKQWLKKAPQKRQVTRTLYEVVFEWHFARRWSNSLYNGDSETDNP